MSDTADIMSASRYALECAIEALQAASEHAGFLVRDSPYLYHLQVSEEDAESLCKCWVPRARQWIQFVEELDDVISRDVFIKDFEQFMLILKLHCLPRKELLQAALALLN